MGEQSGTLQVTKPDQGEEWNDQAASKAGHGGGREAVERISIRRNEEIQTEAAKDPQRNERIACQVAGEVGVVTG